MPIQFIWGLGSGRNGSGTLADFLGLQKGIWAKHEGGFCPWEKDIVAFYQSVIALIAETTETRIATVALYWKSYLSEIFRDFADPKVIVLKRDKEKVVESFTGLYQDRNFWSVLDGENFDGYTPKNNPLKDWFPKYDLPKKEAIGKYWEEYYNDGAIDYWMNKFPQNMMMVRSEDFFASEDTHKQILEFLDIPEEDMVFDMSIQKNKSPDDPPKLISINREPPKKLGEMHKLRSRSGLALEYAEMDTSIELQLTPEEFKQIEKHPEIMKLYNKEEELNA